MDWRACLPRTSSVCAPRRPSAGSPSSWWSRWRVTNLVDASDYMLRGVAFSIRALLEHTGKRVLEVTWTRTRSGAEYQIRWEA